MEPYESGANGRGRRKRRLPLDQTEGGGFGPNPVSGDAGPREEDSVRRLIDRLNMCSSSRSSNAAIGMPAMRVVRRRSVCLTHFVAGECMARDKNNGPRSRGEQGPVLWKANLPQGGTREGEEGMCPPRPGHLVLVAREAQSGRQHVSHAPIA